MSATLDSYRRDLLAELRKRSVPNQRIAEAIAEVESHVAETGEEPQVAFGDPGTYADELAGALGRTRPSFTSRMLGPVVAIAAFAGAALATSGVTARLREHAWTSSSTLPIVGGAVLLGVAFIGGLRSSQGMTDPRTGRGLRVPASRWALPVAAAVIAVALVAVLAFRAAAPR